MKLQIFIFILIIPFILFAQKKEKNNDYGFKEVIHVKDTPIKNQSASGTCWSFAACSFLESELIRLKKEELNISEMFFVRHAYNNKASDYVESSV